jgi:hypothetical protein
VLFQWSRMVSCAAIANRRMYRLTIGTQDAKLPHKRTSPCGQSAIGNATFSTGQLAQYRAVTLTRELLPSSSQ